MTIVEAGSLSTITHLASNPPAVLQDSRHRSLEPLVLYIARVPGSRDVFLTPIKPREKIVTAEDIKSSLYFLHSNHEDDTDLVVRAHQREQPSPDDLRATTRLPDHKIGLEIDPYALSWSRQQHVTSQPVRQTSIRRKPVLADVTNRSCSRGAAVNDMPLLPPRPLPKLPQESATYTDDQPPQVAYIPDPLLPMTPTETKAMEALTGALTLIRRDPATAEQWNVAMIEQAMAYDHVVKESDQQYSRKASGRPLQLTITNPSYHAFHSRTTDEPLHGMRHGTFSRLLRVQSRSSTVHDADALGEPRTSFSGEDKQNKRRSRFLPDQTRRRDQTQYSFLSPWNEVCRFTTSSTGRALSCSHRSREVSELRFNLPLASGTSTAVREESRHSRLENSRHSLKPGTTPPIRANGDSDASDEEGMDLSLGRERAGGGFGGKQAKLGKLIIYADGFPMLDLLVAANIGLWWRAWDRTL